MIDKIIKVIGIGALLGTWIVMYYTFLVAYSDPSKSTLVTVDTYNEANWEFVLFTSCIPFIICSIYLIIKEIENGHRNR